jgi:hypothetical protein
MGGYIASPRKWNDFNEAWAATLLKYQVPEFHAKEFFAANRRRHLPYYSGWSQRKVTQFIHDLTTVIHRRRLTAICGALNVDAFNSLTYGERRFLTGGGYTSAGKWISQGAPNKPIRFAFFSFIREAVNNAKDGCKVHFILDRQEQHQGGMLQEFEAIARSGTGAEQIIDSTKVGDMTFSDRRGRIALQAADLFSNSWYHELFFRDQQTPERAAAMCVLSEKRRKIWVMEAADFDIYLDQAMRELGGDRDFLRRMGPRGLDDV